ncbi:MAG: ABC transporter substrate-binding protein, partial [Clostridia bacterium]|nr:ABC transporter substrate-binding protein [Clostridia bacterium]
YTAGRYATWVETYKPGILAEMKLRYGKEVVYAPIMKPYITSARPAAMTAVSKTSKHPELALKLIELMNTDKELYNLISYGIEGKHYTLDSEGKVEYIENSGYAPKAAWKFGNQFNAYLVSGQEDTVWDDTRAMNDNALRSPILGFSVDTKNIKNEISQVSSVYKEFSMANKGIADLEDYYDDLIAKLKTAGIDKITEEAQRQYDEWKKNNK